MKTSIRDIVTGEITLDYFAGRLGQGWKLESLEWVRDSEDAGPSETTINVPTSLPYGLQLMGNGAIQENLSEATILFHVLDQVIKERTVQEIAGYLNARGYLTRDSAPWSASTVFDLLPRLIEVGPSLVKSNAWLNRQGSPPIRQSLH